MAASSIPQCTFLFENFYPTTLLFTLLEVFMAASPAPLWPHGSSGGLMAKHDWLSWQPGSSHSPNFPPAAPVSLIPIPVTWHLQYTGASWQNRIGSHGNLALPPCFSPMYLFPMPVTWKNRIANTCHLSPGLFTWYSQYPGGSWQSRIG